VKGETYLLSSLWEKNVKEGELCDNLTGHHLSRGGLTNPPQKEQYEKTVHTAQAHWARGVKTRSPYD